MNFEEKIVRYRVSVGIIVLLIVLIFAEPTFETILWGAIVGFIGVLIRAWASGHLNKNNELTVSGPYRFSRNPLYLGNIIMAIGLMINSNNYISIIILLVYLLLFYPFLIIREKNYLKKKFDNYKDFEKVSLLFPNPFKYAKKTKETKQKFLFERYFTNREYNAFLGFLIIILLFVLRIYLKKIIGW
jgi:protein-S-isoprenylcysteine O-methyltransferase Ste14